MGEYWVEDLLKEKKFEEIKERIIKDPSLLEAKDELGNTPLLTVLGYFRGEEQ